MIKKVHKMEDVELIFNQAIEENAQSIAIIQTIPYQRGTEMIVNHRNNIKNRLEYLKKHYKEDLTHNHHDRIQILAAGYGECDVWNKYGEIITE